jgi:hypothetical protein
VHIDAELGYITVYGLDEIFFACRAFGIPSSRNPLGEGGGEAAMTCSLKDLRAFAVRNRLDVTFHAHATGAAWMVNRRGLVARPTLGEATASRVEDTLEAADEFLLEGDKQPRRRLSREQFLELMAARAAAGGAGRERDDE